MHKTFGRPLVEVVFQAFEAIAVALIGIILIVKRFWIASPILFAVAFFMAIGIRARASETYSVTDEALVISWSLKGTSKERQVPWTSITRIKHMMAFVSFSIWIDISGGDSVDIHVPYFKSELVREIVRRSTQAEVEPYLARLFTQNR